MAKTASTKKAPEQMAWLKLPPPGPLRRLLLYAVLLTGLFVPTYQGIYDERVFMGGDNADYFILAESIATGHGYRDISFLDAAPHNHFPPGYPFVMAMFMKIGITELTTLTMLNGVFLWGALMMLLVLFYRWSRSPELAAAAIVLCTFNAYLLGYATIMMSEIPCLFFIALTLLSYTMLMRAGEHRRRRTIWLVVLVCSSILMLYVRTATVAVVLSLSLHLAWQRRFKLGALYFGLMVLSQVPWQIRSAALGGNSYVKQLLSINPYRPEMGQMQLKDWPSRLGDNIQRYTYRELPSSILPWTEKASTSTIVPGNEWVFAALLIPLIIAGLLLLRRDKLLVALVVVSSLALLLFWPPVWTGVRFILPLTPFLIFLACFGLFALLALIAGRMKLPAWSPWVAVAPVLFATILHLQDHPLLEGPNITNDQVKQMLAVRAMKVDRMKKIYYAPCVNALAGDRRNPYPDNYNEFLQVASWAGKNIPLKDTPVICNRKPSLFYLFSRRHVTTYAKTLNADSLLADLRARKVTHVVVDQLGFADEGRYLVPVIQRDPDKFPVIHTETNPADPRKVTYLLAFKPDLGYQGRWVGQKKEGEGVIKYADGSVFKGVWQNDTIHGEGTLTRKDGSVIEGQWYAGKLNGYGKWTMNGQVRQEGQWKNGTFLGAAPAATPAAPKKGR